MTPDYVSRHFMNLANGCDGLRFILHNVSRHPMIDNFGNRSSVESDHRRSASHSLNHHDAKWLGPVDGHENSHRSTQAVRLLRFADLTLHFDRPAVYQRSDDFGEIVPILLIDFRCNLQRDASLSRNSDRPLRSLIWAHAPEKCKIA